MICEYQFTSFQSKIFEPPLISRTPNAPTRPGASLPVRTILVHRFPLRLYLSPSPYAACHTEPGIEPDRSFWRPFRARFLYSIALPLHSLGVHSHTTGAIAQCGADFQSRLQIYDRVTDGILHINLWFIQT